MLIYYGIFHPEEKGGFSVAFEDVEAYTQGEDLDDAVDMAVDVLSIVLSDKDAARRAREPFSYEEALARAEPGDLVLPVTPRIPVEADFRRCEPVSVLLPECQLRAVDKVGAIIGQDRSAFITRALDEFFAAYYADVTV